MNDNERIELVKENFLKSFNYNSSDLFTSPGRIELLGNHTDHNNGKVLVSSVNLNILVASSKTDSNHIRYCSTSYNPVDVDLNDLEIKEEEFGSCLSIIRGVAYKFKELGYKIGGFDLYGDSNVPKAAGVSSSASFEILIAKMFSYYYNNDSVKPFELAQIGQFSETVFFNKPCGLLDQSGIALGGINFIDFKNTKEPEIKHVEANFDGYQFILIKTGGNHAELTPCYSAIKDEMKNVANHFGKSVLREIDSFDTVEENKNILISNYGERAYLRAKHYFEENDRVSIAFKALENGDNKIFFEMLNASGVSSYYQLQNCYVENEDELLPKALRKVKEIDNECYSRVHGGGFAGTMLMIVKNENLNNDLSLLNDYFGKDNVLLVNPISTGTRKID